MENFLEKSKKRGIIKSPLIRKLSADVLIISYYSLFQVRQVINELAQQFYQEITQPRNGTSGICQLRQFTQSLAEF